MKLMPKLVQVYLALIIGSASGIAAWLLASQGLPTATELPLATLLGIGILLAWIYPLPVGFDMHFYLDTAVLIGLALVFEPGTAMLIVGAGTLLGQRVRQRAWDEAIFNCGKTMLQVALVALTMSLAGYHSGLIEIGNPGYIVAVLVAGIVLYLSGAIMAGTVIALQRGENPLPVWTEAILNANDSAYLGHFAQVGLAIVIANLAAAHYWTIALLVPIVAVVYRALKHGMELRRITEMALRLREKNFIEAQRLARIGSWEWDLTSGAQGWSQESFRLLGFEAPFPEPRLEHLLERVHPEDRPILDSRIRDAIQHREDFELEHRIIQPNGSELMVHHRGEVIQDDIEGCLRVVAMIHDISERRSLERKLKKLAFYDSLTGLLNRMRLVDELESMLEDARHTGSQFAVLFIDLDSFKQVNDNFGHKAGDEALIAISRRLSNSLRSEDVAARYGGDEFIVLARSVQHIADAEHMAQRVLENLSGTVALEDGKTVSITCSIGIIMPDTAASSSSEILQQVDTALYQAKRLGKDTYTVYNSDEEQSEDERIA